MIFSSAIFLFVFLPVVFIIYRLVPHLKYRNLLLAAASIVFYSFGQLKYVPLFLLSVVINYGSGLLLMRCGRNRKLILAASVVLNIGILCYFKYTDFAIRNFNSIFSAAVPYKGIELPIGISFFTFQGLSYTIDVYRNRNSGTKYFLKLLLYISFFPQLIAGPIVKYHDISSQIDARECTPQLTEYGLKRFIIGLSKKLLIANTVGLVADKVFNDYLPAGINDWRLMWLGGICYTLQIYYDFSGYSDMAIGIGRMFGFSFLENFDHPYGSSSIKEFWRKWHISLSSWFKEYLYIPLGGNRKGRLRTILNKLIVFFCTGIWHGANWTFVLWGLGHGLLSSLEDLGLIPVSKLSRSRAGRIVGRLYTLLAVMLLFVLFRAQSVQQAFYMIRSMFCGAVTNDGGFLLRTLLDPARCTVIFAAALLAGNLPAKLKTAAARFEDGAAFRVISVLFMLFLYLLCILSLSAGGFNPFIYFQF